MNGYIDDDKFYKKVGILDEEELESLGWSCDNSNMICISQHDKLVAFIATLNTQSIQFIKGIPPKRYHIATALENSGLEDDYREENNLGEDATVVGELLVNRVGFVDSMYYFLCDGDDNEELFLRYVEEI